MYTIERYHDISCGHRVAGHENKCAHLHGHNYRITFTCASVDSIIDVTTLGDKQVPHLVPSVFELDAVGRVLDFSIVKEKLCQWLENNWDHRFLIWDKDDLMEQLCVQPVAVRLAAMLNESLVRVSFNPTAENMAQYLTTVVAPQQLDGTGVRVIRCQVEETRKCSASYWVENL